MFKGLRTKEEENPLELGECSISKLSNMNNGGGKG